MEHEPEIDKFVNANDNFITGDIVIDADNLPWRYFQGRWSSTWSAKNGLGLSNELDEEDDTIIEFGLTTRQLMVNKVGYGPFTLIWRVR